MTTKTDQELKDLLTKTREELRSVRFAAAGARAKNPNDPKNLRKAVARILTEQRARVIKAA